MNRRYNLQIVHIEKCNDLRIERLMPVSSGFLYSQVLCLLGCGRFLEVRMQ